MPNPHVYLMEMVPMGINPPVKIFNKADVSEVGGGGVNTLSEIITEEYKLFNAQLEFLRNPFVATEKVY